MMYLRELEEAFDCDCLAYIGPIAFSADDDIRNAIEGIQKKRRKLLFLQETNGGYAETASA
jgi:hypothetical protein